ncbi:MAG: hypothetical protein FWE85_04520, partial [Clostridiales bacterium]|nr:hypothetical protein [Clostridiales bacterium]
MPKNKQIIESWNKVEADETARERMLNNIAERARVGQPDADLRKNFIYSGAAAGNSGRSSRRPGGMRLSLRTLMVALAVVILSATAVFAVANGGAIADIFKNIARVNPQDCETCGKDPCVCPGIDPACQICGEEICTCPDITPACQVCGEDDCDCGVNPPIIVCAACGEETCVCPWDGVWAGKGTVSDPLQVTRPEQLAEIARLVNLGELEKTILGDPDGTVYIKLMNDISLSAYASGKGWVPIGGYNNGNGSGIEELMKFAFKGIFDGNGKTVSGLYINDP